MIRDALAIACGPVLFTGNHARPWPRHDRKGGARVPWRKVRIGTEFEKEDRDFSACLAKELLCDPAPTILQSRLI